MHTAHPKIHRRLAIAGAGLLGLAGLGVFAIGGATGALAQSYPAATDTTATATVTSALSIADNTSSINFGAGAAIPGNSYSQTVATTVNSNDAGGYYDTAEVVSSPVNQYAGFIDPAGDPILASNLTANSVAGSTTAAGFVPGATSGDVYANVDHSSSASVAGGDNYSDTWTLNIPSSQTPGSYAATIYYEVTGN